MCNSRHESDKELIITVSIASGRRVGRSTKGSSPAPLRPLLFDGNGAPCVVGTSRATIVVRRHVPACRILRRKSSFHIRSVSRRLSTTPARVRTSPPVEEIGQLGPHVSLAGGWTRMRCLIRVLVSSARFSRVLPRAEAACAISFVRDCASGSAIERRGSCRSCSVSRDNPHESGLDYCHRASSRRRPD